MGESLCSFVVGLRRLAITADSWKLGSTVHDVLRLFASEACYSAKKGHRRILTT